MPVSTSRRSARAHTAVLDAASELVLERGYGRLTVDAICARSGVSKATVYRWWPNRAAIVVEALLESVQPDVAYPDTGSLREDLVGQATALARALTAPGLGGTLVALLGEAHDDRDLATALRTGWQEPRRAAGREVVQRAVRRGELPADVDADLVLDGVYGPLYLRLLFGHAGLGRDEVQRIVDQVLDGCGGGHRPG